MRRTSDDFILLLVFIAVVLSGYTLILAVTTSKRVRAELTQITCYAGSEIVIRSVASRYNTQDTFTYWEEYVTGTPMMTALPCLIEPYEESEHE